MKTIYLIPVMFKFIAFLSLSSNASINFQKISIDQALINAKILNKNLFVEFTAENCGPCVWMENNVFTNPELARLVNVNFLSIKSDGTTTQSKFEKYSYKVNMLPTIIFISADGEEIFRVEGKVDAAKLEEITRLVLDKNQSELEKIMPKKEPQKDIEREHPILPISPERKSNMIIQKSE